MQKAAVLMLSVHEKPFSVQVRVPATSANVGVGFDCLGLALDLFATVQAQPADTLSITGCEERFCNEDNLVWQSYCSACTALGQKPRPLALHIDSPIPLTGGLGSSSMCVVAGVAIALAQGPGWDADTALSIACELERHPDNVAPAILGGLVSSFMTDGAPIATPFSIDPAFRFVVIAPPYEVRTEDARRVLPNTVPLSTAVWQLGRVVATTQALLLGDAKLLSQACDDRLHEPWRAQLIPDYTELKQLCQKSGAATFVISGSGATMIAICDGADSAEQVEAAVRHLHPDWWLQTLACTDQGTHLTALLD